MGSRSIPGLLVLLALGACGDDASKRTSSPPPAAPAASEASGDDAIDSTSDSLRELLPRALTAKDVEDALLFTPIVEEGDEYAASAEFQRRGVDEKAWNTASARVAMAYAQLLMADHGVQKPPHAKQLLADIEVVRPFQKRLAEMHAARRAKEEASVDRSGHMVSLSRPEFLYARREAPLNWEAFVEPVTRRSGFRVKAGAGEQILVVRSQGGLVAKTKRYALQAGGTYVEDADQIVIRPTGGASK
jgi:hypothetical protein